MQLGVLGGAEIAPAGGLGDHSQINLLGAALPALRASFGRQQATVQKQILDVIGERQAKLRILAQFRVELTEIPSADEGGIPVEVEEDDLRIPREEMQGHVAGDRANGPPIVLGPVLI